jgi:hypothetical protein
MASSFTTPAVLPSSDVPSEALLGSDAHGTEASSSPVISCGTMGGELIAEGVVGDRFSHWTSARVRGERSSGDLLCVDDVLHCRAGTGVAFGVVVRTASVCALIGAIGSADVDCAGGSSMCALSVGWAECVGAGGSEPPPGEDDILYVQEQRSVGEEKSGSRRVMGMIGEAGRPRSAVMVLHRSKWIAPRPDCPLDEWEGGGMLVNCRPAVRVHFAKRKRVWRVYEWGMNMSNMR